MNDFYNSMPESLRAILDAAEKIDNFSEETVKQSIRVIDHTSLKDGDKPMLGAENTEDIISLCEQAKGKAGINAAAVCVYPNHIETAKKALTDSDVLVAVVNNFPHGNLSANEAASDVEFSAKAGADEIDTVVDYVALQNDDLDIVKEKLLAVSSACKQNNVKLKTILKASVYKNYDDLYSAAMIAIECGADFVKTCTGKEPLVPYGNGKADASDLLMTATVMQAVKDSGKADVGVKISGGVKYPVDCEKMRYLADNILGEAYFNNKDLFRFGASSLLSNLETALA